MTKLDDAMELHMVYIVLSEKRPFCFRDFLDFRVDEIKYHMQYGTFRNKISKLVAEGKVEICYYSGCAFYTLKGHKFGKKVTPNRMVIPNNPIYNFLLNLPLNEQCIHNIRLRLNVSKIWTIASRNRDFTTNKKSKDIVVPTWSQENTLIRIIIHKTNNVSVILGCSLEPISLDHDGIIRFSTLLARVEEKLKSITENPGSCNCKQDIVISNYRKWVITMWHFGRDSLTEFNGERFSITVEDTQHILRRIYVKDFNGKQKIRIERQEYPKVPVEEIIDNVLDKS